MYYKNQNQKQEYLRQSVMTASPPELVVMLLDACVKNVKLAGICLEERRDIDGANAHFQKAQKIIMELTNCLDTRFALSAELLKIYEFLLRTVRGMNASKDLSLLPDVLDILTSLRDTWEQVARPSFVRPAEVS